jgi:hypothetical protein
MELPNDCEQKMLLEAKLMLVANPQRWPTFTQTTSNAPLICRFHCSLLADVSSLMRG